MKLFESFKPISLTEWEHAAGAEVGEGKQFQDLRWQTADGLLFEPIYTTEQIDNLAYLNAFKFRDRFDGISPRQWANVPLVIANDEKAANAEALDHLRHEADGVVFQLQDGDHDFGLLLKNVEVEHCAVIYLTKVHFSFDALSNELSNRNIDPMKLSGAVFRENLDQKIELQKTSLSQLGITIPASTPVQEVAQALTQAVKIVSLYIQNGYTAYEVIGQIAFSIPLSTQLLLDVAKLKALRNLWYQVTQAYGVNQYAPQDLYLHGRSEPWINEKFQPHGNMLKSTVAAIAAIGGGCNALTIVPEDNTNPVMRRIARNTSTILMEESHFGKVRDPFAGTYSIQVITDEISKAAWSIFKKAKP